MVTVYFRTLFMYLFLILALRLMGKRQVGELQVSELIVTFMLSELAVNPISNRDLPILYAVVPVLLLLSLEVIVSFLMLKSNRMKRLLYGRPAVVIRYGKIQFPVLRKHRVELDELLSELRQKGIAHIEDVAYAILEENGKLSVFPRTELQPVTPKDAHISVPETGIAHAIVIDGTVLPQNLTLCGKDERWLARWLAKNKTAVDELFLLTLDDGGKAYHMTKADCLAELHKKRG